jgi:hypothetical protein
VESENDLDAAFKDLALRKRILKATHELPTIQAIDVLRWCMNREVERHTKEGTPAGD